MKKSTSIFLAYSLFTSIAFAQTEPKGAKSIMYNGRTFGTQIKRSNTAHEIKSSTAFWTNDFSNALDWTAIAINGVAAWTIGTGVPSGPFAIPPIASTTDLNGYAMFDSDLDCSFDQITNLTIKSPVNLSQHPQVALRFEQYYRKYIDSTFVFVSKDSINWVKFPVNEFYLLNQSNTNNPDKQEINISSVAGSEDSVWIRFQFYSPASLDTITNVSGCAYAWMIDDVSLDLPTQIDATLLGVDVPNGCNLSSTDSIVALVKNAGVDTLSGLIFNYKIDNGQIVSDTTIGDLLPGATVAHRFTQTADFSAPGNYLLTVYLTKTIGDEKPLNDSLLITVSNFVSRVEPYYFMGFEPVNTDELGLWTYTNNNADGATWALGTTGGRTEPNCAIKGTSVSNDDDWLFSNCTALEQGKSYNLVVYSKPQSITRICDLEIGIGENAFDSGMTIIYTRPTAVNTLYYESIIPFTVPSSGSYYFGYHFYSSTGSLAMRLDDISITEGALGISNSNKPTQLSLFPNPSSGNVNLSIQNKVESVYSISITDITGRVIRKMNTPNLLTVDIDLDFSNYSNGIYFINVQSEQEVYSERIIIQK